MGLFSHHILPTPPAEFLASHQLLPGLRHFFTTGDGLGFEQLAALPKWGKEDWLERVTSQAGLLRSWDELKQLGVSWYASYDSLTLALAFCVWTSVGCFVMQELTNNLSACHSPGSFYIQL